MKCELPKRDRMIDDCLSGALSGKELQAFEEHLFSCEACSKEIRFQEELASLVKEEGQTLFADYLKAQKTKHPDIPKTLNEKFPRLSWTRPTKLSHVTVAATAILLMVFVIYRLLLPPSLDSLSEIEPHPFLEPSTLSDVSEGRSVFFDGMDYYVLEKYDLARERLEVARGLDPQLKDVHFYLGLSYLLQRKLDKAMKYLKIAAEGVTTSSEKEHWYLGLAYLRQGEKQKALHEFQVVANLGQRRYADKAEALIIRLRELGVED